LQHAQKPDVSFSLAGGLGATALQFDIGSAISVHGAGHDRICRGHFLSMYELQYVPLALPFFILFFGLFLFLVVLIQLHVLHYAYAKLGLSSGAALLVLLASLIGSYFNIPLTELPEREVRSGEVIEFFGMRYVVPLVTDWPRTVIAVNIGGAVIPTLLSLYLLIKNDILSSAAVATAVVMVACYLLAQPVPGVGIAIPSLVPPIIAATTALLVAQRNVSAVAYVSGSLGTLIGADLLNLGKIRGLGAPVMSIGGAGTFDGIFLTGILAVLLASFSPRA
jgi:uncharacterized membrane protein